MPGRPIALDLSRLDTDAPFDARPALVGVIEDLVSLLETQMPDDADFASEPLRTRLKHSRMRVRTSQTADDLHDAGLRLVGDASQTHARIAGHIASRESELFGVIRLLRELVDALKGDAQAFRADISKSSARVEDLAKIDDVRTLRKALSREVDELRRSVQTQEARETARLAQLSGKIQHIEHRLVDDEQDQDRTTRLPRRQALERRLASIGASETCTLVLLRIDEPDEIAREHGRNVVDRVVLCLAQLVQATFGAQTVTYRVDTQSAAVAITGQSARAVSQILRQAQARMAPEYEYETQGSTRSVMFTFSSGIADRQSGEAPADLVHRAETLAAHAANQGRGRMEVAGSKLGRLLGWM
jgi:GGDEF domain-containing protein